MRTVFVALALLCAAASVAATATSPEPRGYAPRRIADQGRRWWIWFDDLEPADPGWAHGDYTASYSPFFHVDTYMAHGGAGHSYWCGTFDHDADGGYGNNWDDRLNLPPIEPVTLVEETSWGAIKARYRDAPGGARTRERDPVYPVLTFAYRNDSEPAYDFTYVQAESSGAFTNLNRGYDGVHPWGQTGFYLGNMDVPFIVRFRFVSDGAWSDADGQYLSNGGAFMCDEVQVWDYHTGEIFFHDDVEGGGLCTPSGPGAAGDYWRITESNCKASSDPHVWVNTSPDTNGAMVPPGVQNWLRTPTVYLSGAYTCTTYFIIQFFTPMADDDYWTETMWLDGVGTQLHAWWGDQCDAGYGPCDHFAGGDDVSALLPASSGYHEWVYRTTDNGAGPDACDCAGITLDDIGFYGQSI